MELTINHKVDGSTSKVSIKKGYHSWTRRVEVRVYDNQGFYKPQYSWSADMELQDIERQLEIEKDVVYYSDSGKAIDSRIAII